MFLVLLLEGISTRSIALGVFSGIFLWQSIGEDAWHFSVGGMHFACLESISVLPLVIAFILLMCYCAKHRMLDWGVWCAILSFAVNWLGHYVLIGVYPIIAPLIEKALWCRCVGIVLGAAVIISGVVCGVKKSRSRKEMMLSAILTYYGVGVMMFGIIG